MKRRTKTIISTRIEANKDKIYRIGDVHDLADMVFTSKNAVDLRTGFILIFLSIKYSEDQRSSTVELEYTRKEKACEVSRKSLWKARAVMARIGLITRRDGCWQFSSKFGKTLQNLADMAARLTLANGSATQEDKDWFLLECTRGMPR